MSMLKIKFGGYQYLFERIIFVTREMDSQTLTVYISSAKYHYDYIKL